MAIQRARDTDDDQFPPRSPSAASRLLSVRLVGRLFIGMMCRASGKSQTRRRGRPPSIAFTIDRLVKIHNRLDRGTRIGADFSHAREGGRQSVAHR
jgi:hypothetical protein